MVRTTYFKLCIAYAEVLSILCKLLQGLQIEMAITFFVLNDFHRSTTLHPAESAAIQSCQATNARWGFRENVLGYRWCYGALES